MKRLHVVYSILLIAAAVTAVSMGSASKQRADRKKDKRKAARERRAERLRNREPLAHLAGQVVEAEGRPVKGATVFILPKKKRGAERDDLVHVVTPADGTWRLRTRKLAGCWIGVIAPGYRNAWLDGDDVDLTAPIRLTVKPSPPLEVQLTRDGKPLAGQGVQLEPWPPSAFHFLPGPESRQGERWAVSDARGIATFRLGAPGPVQLTPQIEGHHTHPRTLWLADGRGRVDLLVHRSTTLEAEVTDANASKALEGSVTVELFDPSSGRSIGAHTGWTKQPGLLRIENALTPGLFHARVSAPSFAPSVVTDLHVPEHPGVATFRVGLLPAPAATSLTLRLQGVGGTRASRGRRRAPLSFLLRDDPAWRRFGWQPGAPESWDRKTGRLVFALAPGRYHVLVADVLTGRAAILRNLQIGNGTPLERTVRLNRGLQPTLPALRDTLTPAGSYPRLLRIRSAAWPSLPVYGSTPEARTRMGSAVDVIAGQLGGDSVRLGPYPVAEIELEVVDWSGGTRTHSLK